VGHELTFGRHRFDAGSGRLWCGAREVRLTPKATAVLAALTSRPGELVTKQELFASIWSGVAVSDDALTSCVQELRKALGDRTKPPRFIETRHRRGYRFIAPVAQVPTDEAPAPERELPTGTHPGPDSLGAGDAGKPTVAILPFNNLSADTEQDYIADGIAEDLITALSRHRSLLVIARSSAFSFKGRPIDARQAGVNLGAHYVVEGSVARLGSRLRISVRLVETEGGRHVWGERYDRAHEEMFEVQDEIVVGIAARIEPEVSLAERKRSERKSPDALRAWDFFHLGMQRLYKASVEDNREAQRLFRRAIDLDPGLGQAHCWLSYAIVLSMVYFDAEPAEDRLTAAVAFARKGVDLDDQDALAHFVYGRALLGSKAYDDALAEFELAAGLNPGLAVAYCGLGDSLAYEGRIEDAIPYFEKAVTLSPYDPQRWAFYAYRALAHLCAGQYERALEWSQKAIRVPNCHYWPFAHRVSALGHLQQIEAAAAAKGELLARKPDFTCAEARRRLFFIKNPAHLDLYVEGLLKAGIAG
jgi:TolB-like protein/Tfp pilus assembly protein PilF